MDRSVSPAAGIPHVVALNARAYPPSSVSNSFKLDEGYSDETRSQPDTDPKALLNDGMMLLDWLSTQSESDRAGRL